MNGTVGILLAGGVGSRLGSEVPKPEFVVRGLTLRDRALSTLSAVCERVVIVTPRDRRPGGIDDAAWIEDAGEGPLSGIVAGLAADTFDRAIVLGVDFPLVKPELLTALAHELERSLARAVMCAPGGIPQPLVAALAPGAADALRDAFAAGQRSVTRAMFAMGALVVGDDFIIAHGSGPADLMNVNTALDAALADRALAERERLETSRGVRA